MAGLWITILLIFVFPYFPCSHSTLFISVNAPPRFCVQYKTPFFTGYILRFWRGARCLFRILHAGSLLELLA